MGFWKDESGQVLVLTAVSMLVLLGFVGLAIDVGFLFRAKRNMQIAADAAATAAVLDYIYHADVDKATTAAYDAAKANGVDHSVTGNVVTVSSPPADGPETGTAAGQFIEVRVSTKNPTYFMGVLTGSKSLAVAARAVGGTSSSKGCVYTLAKTGLDIDDSASGSIVIPTCGIIDNSSSSPALSNSGSKTITASSIQVVGGYSMGHLGNISPTPTTGSIPVSDPLSALSPPSSWPPCLADPHVNSTATIGPAISGGTICYSGLTISAGSGTVTLNPGIYVINGTLSITGSAPVNGTGVTFYLPSGSSPNVSITASATMKLIAPTSGKYDGILFYQDRANTNAIKITAAGGSTITGIIYAPTATLDMTGSGGVAVIAASLVVGSIKFTGSGDLSFQDYALVNSGTPLRRPLLVE